MQGHRIIPFYVAVAGLVCAAPSFAAAPAAAQSADQLMNMPLESLLNVEVTSVSKYAQKESEAPSAVEVITADDIRTFGYRTLGEALNGLHGLYASSDRNYNYLGVNGFLRPGDYNSRILVMIDGRRMNDNIYDGANTGQEFMLDMDLVDHIEYIPGPGSSIYGANAMEGVINVISKKGSDINGLQAKGSYGTFDTGDARFTYGKKLPNGADVLLSASEYYSGGPQNLFYPEFNQPFNNNGFAHNMDAERSSRLFAKIEDGDYTFTGGYVDRFKRVPIASFGTIFNDPGYSTTDTQGFAEFKINRQLDDKTTMQTNIYYQSYYYHAFFPFDNNPFPPPPPIDRIVDYDAVDGRWAGFETNFVTSRWDRQKVVAGLEFQYDFREHVWNNNIFPYQLFQNTNNMGARTGAYVQDDYKLRDNLTVSAGVRADQNHLVQALGVNPRLGLIWDARPDTTIKLLYGSAFRAPNVYERDLNTQGNAANENNKAEHVKNYQAIAEWKPLAGLKMTGGLFDNQFNHVLTQDPTSLQFVNSGKYDSYGYDLGLDQRWVGGRNLRASFDHNILYNQNVMPGSDPNVWAVDSPKNVFKLMYAEPLHIIAADTKLGLEDDFVDQRRTEQMGKAAPYSLFNANLSARGIFPGADAAFGVYNLFNSHPQMVGGDGASVVNADQIVQNVIPMNGRSVQLTLQYTY